MPTQTHNTCTIFREGFCTEEHNENEKAATTFGSIMCMLYIYICIKSNNCA
jgi:hypothetical protein